MIPSFDNLPAILNKAFRKKISRKENCSSAYRFSLCSRVMIHLSVARYCGSAKENWLAAHSSEQYLKRYFSSNEAGNIVVCRNDRIRTASFVNKWKWKRYTFEIKYSFFGRPLCSPFSSKKIFQRCTELLNVAFFVRAEECNMKVVIINRTEVTSTVRALLTLYLSYPFFMYFIFIYLFCLSDFVE